MTYIFLTPELGSMGGSQMYVCNKSMYLRYKGWNVKICYFVDSRIMIGKFNDLDTYFFPELAWGVQYYFPSRARKIIKKVAAQLSSNDQDVVIESCLYHLSYWGEMLASELKAKHILHFLEEDIPIISESSAAFMEYKLYRWECMNASEQSLRRLFKAHFKQIYLKYQFDTDFYCSNVIQEEDHIPSSLLHIEKTDDIILSLGRLDKPYIPEMIKQIVLYARNNEKRSLSILFIGGSPDGNKERKIKEILSEVSNIKTYLLGYMYPVSPSVVKMADVAIATSNSVLVPYNNGVPTIVVDANDFYAIGLYGDNTMNTVFRKDEEKVRISDYLEKVLVKRDFIVPESNISSKPEEELLDDHFKNQIAFLNRSNDDGKYYYTEGVYSYKSFFRGVLVRFYINMRSILLRCIYIF